MEKLRRGILLLGTMSLMLMLTGCGGKEMSSAETIAQTNASMEVSDAGIYDTELAEEAGEGLETSEADTEGIGRKLIKTVSMNVETEEFDGLISGLERRVKELEGYIESSSVRGNARYNDRRYSDMTIRIPSKNLEYFVSEVAEISNVTWKSESIEDITLNYVDTESRKKALEVEQERLLALLEKAESVEDIIAIESRLSEVRYELQSYASQLLVYDNQVEYSTVYLSISEVTRLTPQEEPSMWKRITEGFRDNMGGAAALLENLIVGVIVLIPYWGILAVLIGAAILVCKGISVLQKKKKDTRENRKKKTDDAV